MEELEYYKVLKSGMFWEFHPELTGDYSKDKLEWEIIYQNLLNIRNMNAPGFEKEYKELRHLKVEPKANLQPRVSLNLGEVIDRRIEPKPILIIFIPNGMFREYSIKVQMIERIQSALINSGWLGIVFETEEKEVKVQSFTLKDSQEVQVQALKEQIINEIKGK